MVVNWLDAKWHVECRVGVMQGLAIEHDFQAWQKQSLVQKWFSCSLRNLVMESHGKMGNNMDFK